MKIHEFKKFLDREAFTEFIYASENQLDFDVLSPINACAVFSSIIVCENPNIVQFQHNKTSIRIGRVKKIDCNLDSDMHCAVIYIHSAGSEKPFIFLAS